jgi:hypothetical protein
MSPLFERGVWPHEWGGEPGVQADRQSGGVTGGKAVGKTIGGSSLDKPPQMHAGKNGVQETTLRRREK